MSTFNVVAADISIRDMPPGGVWISPRLLGLSPEEQIASRDGTMPEARQLEIYEAAQRANVALVNMPVPGVQEWMTPRRILS